MDNRLELRHYIQNMNKNEIAINLETPSILGDLYGFNKKEVKKIIKEVEKEIKRK